MNWFRTVVASVVLALGYTAVAGHAAPPVAQSAQSEPVNIVAIGEMLKSLGYPVEENRDRNGAIVSYWAKVRLGDASVDVLVELSRNQSTVWFTIPLLQVKDFTSLTPEMLTALLKANANANGMISFLMTPDNELILQTWQHAAGLSESDVRIAIAALIQQAFDTSDVWMRAK